MMLKDNNASFRVQILTRQFSWYHNGLVKIGPKFGQNQSPISFKYALNLKKHA
jgi:hypothetical protein